MFEINQAKNLLLTREQAVAENAPQVR